jgi:hypothetical protein
MTERPKTARESLSLLLDDASEYVSNLTDEELLAETREIYGYEIGDQNENSLREKPVAEIIPFPGNASLPHAEQMLLKSDEVDPSADESAEESAEESEAIAARQMVFAGRHRLVASYVALALGVGLSAGLWIGVHQFGPLVPTKRDSRFPSWITYYQDSFKKGNYPLQSGQTPFLYSEASLPSVTSVGPWAQGQYVQIIPTPGSGIGSIQTAVFPLSDASSANQGWTFGGVVAENNYSVVHSFRLGSPTSNSIGTIGGVAYGIDPNEGGAIYSWTALNHDNQPPAVNVGKPLK